ncbi:tetratricopeptide repeat protein [Aurantibacter sp.]|uniref:tetratricopeptide repeat protein n=1 Tax=Aurantibacter sp. TaxID=2807103 RepID=UPI0035C7A78A
MRWLLFLLLSFSISTLAQNDALGKEYVKTGEFEKAIIIYKKLYKKSPTSSYIIEQLVNCHQELKQYKEAETIILARLQRSYYPPSFIDLGRNYDLQKDTINANLNYQKAIKSIEKKGAYAYTLGNKFEKFSLLEEAKTLYERAMELYPAKDYNMQLARIYGEQGNIEKMFASYLNLALERANYRDQIKRYISDFITENNEDKNNVSLKKILLKNLQTKPHLFWSEMLSWLFIQQKDYKKAFAQEKAIYKRSINNPDATTNPLNRLIELGLITQNQNEPEIAVTIFTFIKENVQDPIIQLTADKYILELKTSIASKKDYPKIKEDYEVILLDNRFPNEMSDLKINYAHFLAFYLEDTKTATKLLKKALKEPLSKEKNAKVKMELGDILVFQEKFNEALIYYTQIQRSLKNSTLSQTARFKVAKTSYYKGDFIWAESQLKILKTSVSQLTANDALDLKLLISDNKQDDSLQVALNQYAKADLLAFQNKPEQAIAILEQIKIVHKTKSIIPQTLLKQAQLFEKTKKYQDAKNNYKFLIDNFKNSILMDNALYNLALIDLKFLNLPEEAKKGFETIIFEHSYSSYTSEARKQYRFLRGDNVK